jgi:hypothetical protein
MLAAQLVAGLAIVFGFVAVQTGEFYCCFFWIESESLNIVGCNSVIS